MTGWTVPEPPSPPFASTRHWRFEPTMTIPSSNAWGIVMEREAILGAPCRRCARILRPNDGDALLHALKHLCKWANDADRADGFL